ncbi:hypothetical protein GKD14_10405 [Paeniclostridium sordellii]|nr:hypothetical protein [Paeniclostridium sordellii]MSB59353.1 hypothetical protein [Paeniclostridium sordellii]
MSNKNSYINKIANHMLNNNMALFIGAGFSNIFGYPSWSKLLKDIIEEYNLKEKLINTNLFSFVSKDEFQNADDINNTILDKLLGVDYLRLAGYIDYILRVDEGISIHNAIRDRISQYEDLRKKNKDVEYLISFFQSNKSRLEDIITTNYDSNVEYCFNNEVSVIHRNLASLNSITYKNRVFKIHGCISDINKGESDGIVITEKDYNNFKNKNKYLFYKIYSFFTEKKIIFMGYSINDPNIRSLLNDVIEENSEKVGLEIYWITREKLKKIDKEYYEEHFKLNIIEEIEIIEFFKELEKGLEKNLELREVTKKDTQDYCKSLIENYKYESFITDAIKPDKINEVLQCLYKQIIEETNRGASNAYFTLLTRCDKDIVSKNRLSIQNIIEIREIIMFYIIDLLDNEESIRTFIKDNNMLDIVINSLIEYSMGHQSFGNYATCIENLLIVYKNFGEEVSFRIEKYIKALAYNILNSCSNHPKYIGYDWKGLEKVKEYISVLEEEDIIRLLDALKKPKYKLKEQILYVIRYSSLGKNKKNELMYKYIYKYDIKSFVFDTIDKLIEEKLDTLGLKRIDRNNYNLRDGMIKFKINMEDYHINQYLYIPSTNDIIFSVEQNYKDNNIEIIVNENIKNYEDYGEFSKSEESIYNYIEEQFDKSVDRNFMSMLI